MVSACREDTAKPPQAILTRGWIRLNWIADASRDFWLDLTEPLSLTQRQAFIVGRKKDRRKTGKSLLFSPSNRPLVTPQSQKQPALRQTDVPLHTHNPVKHQLMTETHSPVHCLQPPFLPQSEDFRIHQEKPGDGYHTTSNRKDCSSNQSRWLVEKLYMVFALRSQSICHSSLFHANIYFNRINVCNLTFITLLYKVLNYVLPTFLSNYISLWHSIE